MCFLMNLVCFLMCLSYKLPHSNANITKIYWLPSLKIIQTLNQNAILMFIKNANRCIVFRFCFKITCGIKTTGLFSPFFHQVQHFFFREFQSLSLCLMQVHCPNSILFPSSSDKFNEQLKLFLHFVQQINTFMYFGRLFLSKIYYYSLYTTMNFTFYSTIWGHLLKCLF